MKKLVFLVLAVLMLFSLVACSSEVKKDSNNSDTDEITDSSYTAPWENTSYTVDPNDPFTGTWVDIYEDIIYDFYIFNGDGTGRFEHDDIVSYMEYEYNDAILTLITYPDTLENPRTQYINYKLEGNELKLEFEEGVEKSWYRQEE